MLEFLEGEASDRKLRLFAAACCRRVWHLLADIRYRTAVETAEVFAEGGMTDEMLLTFNKEAHHLYENLHGDEESAARAAAYSAWRFVEEEIFPSAFFGASNCLRELSEISGQPLICLALLQDVFCNPFRPVSFDPAWLAWNNCTAPKIAQAAYDERELPSGHLDLARLAILADALEEAGCDQPDLLDHLRGPGPHVRGCWAVDLLLGKE
jgi:hypothetical protein